MSNHSIIEHRANYHFVKMEEDYILICSSGKQYPHCKAFILSVLENWTNDKVSKGQEPYVYMTYPEWINALYGLFRRNTIISSLAELEKEKLILKRPCKRYGKDTFEYALNIPVIQARIRELAERDEKYTRPNLNAFKFKRVQKQTRPNLNGSTHPNLNGSEHDDPFKFKPNIDTITEIPSNIDNSISADADSTPSDVSLEVVKPKPQFMQPFPKAEHSCDAECSCQKKEVARVIPASVDKSQENGDKSSEGENSDGQRVKGARKPKKPQDESMTKRIDAVLDCLDGLAAEYAEEPSFKYTRSKAAKDAVKTLLAAWEGLSREQVKAVYCFMMDTPPSNDGWQWSEHMSVKAFCNNFATEFQKMKGRSKNGQSRNGNTPTNGTVSAQAIAAQLARGLMPSAEQLRNERY
jgi:hypothetical protein